MANKLRLGPLPKQQVVKVTIGLSAALKDNLDQYAAAHSELYGEAVDAASLILICWRDLLRTIEGLGKSAERGELPIGARVSTL